MPYVVTQRGADLTEIVDRLAGRTSVLLGHSGVGKSTLVNALVPDAFRAVGVVNAVTGRGRHTSVTALMLALPGGGWIVDTPGIRSFGLAHVDPDQLIEAFPDLHELTGDCPRGCTHGESEPECGLERGHRPAGGAGALVPAAARQPRGRRVATDGRPAARPPGRRRHR